MAAPDDRSLPAEIDDLAGVDLASLDLEHLDLEARPHPSAPSWMKWVTLALLLGTGLVVLAGKVLGGSEPGAFQFSLGAAGFVAGVGGAIWLARRFDELDRKGAARTAARPSQRR